MVTAGQWLRQDEMTDPGPLSVLFDGLSDRPADLRETVSRLIIHLAWLPRYQVTPSSPLSRDTLAVAERLRLTDTLDRSSSLQWSRPPDKRTFGTCRDYALLLCSMLRHHRIPARIRCGFATYLKGATFEDHWICEYFSSGRWIRADAQLDDVQKADLRVTFDCADLPTGAFISAAEVWRHMRSGTIRPEDCGQGDATGLWFMRVNVHRDLLALANHYTSAWDTWRSSASSSRALRDTDLFVVDHVATAIEAVEAGALSGEELKSMVRQIERPPWLT